MVDMQESNAKLRGRSLGMLVQATGESEQRCAEALNRCGDRKTALVHLLAHGASPDRCREALARAGGRVREALAALD
jgi:N-acetylmuramic acid 6-phosphate etherase